MVGKGETSTQPPPIVWLPAVTPLETNMTGWKIPPISNRKYIDSFMVDVPACHLLVNSGRVLLMAEIQLIGTLSHDLQGLYIPGGCFADFFHETVVFQKSIP